MSEVVYFNGAFIFPPDAKIPAASSTALFGRGIFTTIAICGGQPFLWDKHWRRLTHNAAKIGIDLSDHTENSTRKALSEIIEKNGVGDGRARITFFDERPSSIWPSESDKKTSLHIMTGDRRPVSGNFRLTISPYPVNSRSPLADVKSCNYLENLLAYDEAKERGFNEAIRINERGHITSDCMANVFWLREGRLYTPSLTTGCLAGTTREFVMENIECVEVEAEIEVLNEADAIFLTSAGIGIVEAVEFNGRKLAPIPRQIKDIDPRKNTKTHE